MPNPNRPFGMPRTPADIIATAHRAAPFVWRKRVGVNRRLAARQAVRGALNMQKHRLTRMLLAQRKSPPYTAAQRALLREASAGYRNMTWVLLCFNENDADNRQRVKDLTVKALSTIDAMVECERNAGGRHD